MGVQAQFELKFEYNKWLEMLMLKVFFCLSLTHFACSIKFFGLSPGHEQLTNIFHLVKRSNVDSSEFIRTPEDETKASHYWTRKRGRDEPTQVNNIPSILQYPNQIDLRYPIFVNNYQRSNWNSSEINNDCPITNCDVLLSVTVDMFTNLSKPSWLSNHNYVFVANFIA